MEEPERNRPQLTVVRSDRDGVRIIELDGELDLNSVGELDAALAAVPATPRVCLDLTALGFIDSTGLASVIRGHLTVVEAGGAFAIVTGDGPVHRTFETTGLLALLSVVGDREAALRKLA